jgi:hypothetical protein
MYSPPRFLTEEEIEYIVHDLPKVSGSVEMITNSIRTSLIKRLRKYLLNVKLVPEAIDEFKREIIRLFENARIEPGSKVGFWAASSIGQLLTQLVLNSFYTSGLSKTITSGVARMRELIDLTQEPKNPSCTIYFNDAMTFDDVYLGKRVDIVGISVLDVAKDYSVIDLRENPLTETALDIRRIYEAINNVKLPNTFIMRIVFDVEKLMLNRLTLRDVAEAMEDHNPLMLKVVYYPMNMGIVDVYPIQEMVEVKEYKVNMSEENKLVTFLSLVAQNLKDVMLKGVSNIRNIFPEKLNVESAALEALEIKSNVWRITLNSLIFKTTPITLERVVKLFNLVGVNVLKSTHDYIEVAYEGGNPLKFLRDKINESERIVREEERNKRRQGNIYYRHPWDELLRTARIYYAETNGSDLRSILRRPDVNKRFTYSNNVNEIYEIFGIEAARNMLLREFAHTLVSDGSIPIDPRHIAMVVEFQTNQGLLNPATYIGIQRQPTGPLSKASFERSMNTFFSGALYSRPEPVTNISTSIMTGRPARIGPGIVELQVDKEAIQEIEQRTAPVDPLAFTKAVAKVEAVNLERFVKVFAPSLPKSPTSPTQVPPMPITSTSTSTQVLMDVTINTASPSGLLLSAVSSLPESQCPDVNEFIKFAQSHKL